MLDFTTAIRRALFSAAECACYRALAIDKRKAHDLIALRLVVWVAHGRKERQSRVAHRAVSDEQDGLSFQHAHQLIRIHPMETARILIEIPPLDGVKFLVVTDVC